MQLKTEFFSLSQYQFEDELVPEFNIDELYIVLCKKNDSPTGMMLSPSPFIKISLMRKKCGIV